MLHLSLPYIATQRCLWQDTWWRSGRKSTLVLSLGATSSQFPTPATDRTELHHDVSNAACQSARANSLGQRLRASCAHEKAKLVDATREISLLFSGIFISLKDGSFSTWTTGTLDSRLLDSSQSPLYAFLRMTSTRFKLPPNTIRHRVSIPSWE